MVQRLWSDVLLHYFREVEHPGKEQVWSQLQRWNLNRRLAIRVPPGGLVMVTGGDRMQDALLKCGEFEPEACRWLDQHTQNSDSFWDIGARVGYHAVRLATRFPLREIHCFEVRSACLPLLRWNLARLGPPSYIHPFMPLAGDSDTLDVDAVSRKRLASPPAVIRLDAQGQEVAFLEGGRALWKTHPPRGVLLVTQPDAAGGIADKTLRGWLEENGWVWRLLKENLDDLEPVEVFLAQYAGRPHHLP